MKQSLGAKTLLFPTPVLMVGSYDQARDQGTFYSQPVNRKNALLKSSS